MATFKSQAYINGMPFRAVSEMPFQIAATIKVPNGTGLALNDKLYFFKLGADVRVLDVTLISDDLDTGATVALDVGYEAAVATDVLNFFIGGSTIGQAGGVVRVENGGSAPFAGGAFNGVNETLDIVGLIQVAPTGNPTTDRYITCVVTGVKETGAPSMTPYIYEDRYSTAGVGSI